MIDAIEQPVGFAAALGTPSKPLAAEGAFDAELKRERLEREARAAAEQLVASAFVLPMLQSIREDPFRVGLLDGGSAEELFGQQLDTLMADRIVKGAKLPLVDSIYQSIVNQGQPKTTHQPGIDTHG